MRGCDLCCSLTHTASLIGIAVAKRPVGIDAEEWRGSSPDAAFVERVSSPRRIRQIERAELHDRERLFLDDWVRKEALGKALGVGLDLDLHGRAFAIRPRALGSRHAGIWRVRACPCPPLFSAAVAVSGPRLRLEIKRRPLTPLEADAPAAVRP